ncbi:MAG: zinc ribbon domain-containing protein [Pirellulaceae bacterium]
MPTKISQERKTAYYLGTGMAGFGLLMFLSVFVTGALNFGNFDNFGGQVRSSMFRAIGGMMLIMVGQGIRAVGARGLSGSGVVLDPEQARDDLHPYTNAAGGMLRDVLDAVDRDSEPQTRQADAPLQVIMIRCGSCRQLNEEDDKFCSNCGTSMQ